MNGKNRCLPGPFTSVEMTAPLGTDNFGPGLVAILTGLRGRMVYFLAAGKKSGTAKSTAKRSAAKSVKKASKVKWAKPAKPKIARLKPKAAAKKSAMKIKSSKPAAKKESTAKPVKKGVEKTTAVKAKSGHPKSAAKKANAKKPGGKISGKTSTSKSLKQSIKDDKAKRRKPRVYSTRSKLDGFFIGDEVIFKAVRDWSNAASLKEMRGVVVAMGNDPVNNVSYIEVQFDVEIIPGKTTKQTRRFMVK